MKGNYDASDVLVLVLNYTPSISKKPQPTRNVIPANTTNEVYPNSLY